MSFPHDFDFPFLATPKSYSTVLTLGGQEIGAMEDLLTTMTVSLIGNGIPDGPRHQDLKCLMKDGRKQSLVV